MAESQELPTYEEVTRYQHQPGERPRLVVLIGSLGARLHELKQKVVAENPQHFGVAIPRKRVRVCVFVCMFMHAHMCAHEDFLGP